MTSHPIIIQPFHPPLPHNVFLKSTPNIYNIMSSSDASNRPTPGMSGLESRRCTSYICKCRAHARLLPSTISIQNPVQLVKPRSRTQSTIYTKRDSLFTAGGCVYSIQLIQHCRRLEEASVSAQPDAFRDWTCIFCTGMLIHYHTRLGY